MRLENYVLKCKGRSDVYKLYVLGDVHIGARNCAETHFRKLVRKIKEDPKARWIGGGDLVDAIKMKDKRFNLDDLPNWILEGDADSVRAQLKDVVRQQVSRTITILWDIREKCLGLIEGNHETRVQERFEIDVQRELCEALDVKDLTDCAFLRLQFVRGSSVKTIIVFICHGHGGGRTAGSEPNHLSRLMADKDADIILRGHSHTMEIRPPQPVLYVSRNGELYKECRCRYKRAANWGAWLMSYSSGKGTYSSRACYPARPLGTIEIIMEPHRNIHGEGYDCGRISINECLVE